MSALVLALFPFVPPPPADWASAAVVPNPFLPVPHVAPRPHSAGTVTARSGGWVRVDWGNDSRWVPTALLLTTEQAYAIAAYRHAGSRAAGFAWHRAAVLAAERRGDYAAAVGLLERSILSAPGWSSPRYGRAVARGETGDHAGAARDATAYVIRLPGSEHGRKLLVGVLGDAGRHQEAIDAADRAADELSDNPLAAALPVRARATAGSHATAAAFAVRLLARFPDHPEAYLARGYQRLCHERIDDAAADLDAALDIDPSAQDGVCEIGRALANRGRYAESIACADAVLSRFPDTTTVRYARGRMRYYRQEYAQAEDDLTRVLAADPGHMDALASRACCRLNRQRYEGGIADLHVLADREPANPLLRQAVPRLPEVVAFVQSTDPARARKLAADVDRLTARVGNSGVVQAANREPR